MIWTFSLPAVRTCPGSTAACRSACYARKGRYVFDSIQDHYRLNLRRAIEPDFVDAVSSEARTRHIRVLRIHGSGDFFSAAYVKRWDAIADRLPGTTLYAYTRSWDVPEIREVLIPFAARRNVFLWYSADSDMGVPPRDPGVRVAWMLAKSEGPESVPREADLVFRVGRSEPEKRANGVLVCPYEQGIDRSRGPITCDVCRICFTDYPTKKKD